MDTTLIDECDRLAAECRRRSQAYYDPAVRRELLAMAGEYEAKAAVLREANVSEAQSATI